MTVLYCFVLVLMIFASVIGICCLPINETVTTILTVVVMLGMILGGSFFIEWIVYSKNIKAFSFMDWLFRMNEVYAGWYNDKILLRVRHSNGIDDYSLQGLVNSIKNELVITDKSDRSKPIHIYIDITSNEKTEITIENIE